MSQRWLEVEHFARCRRCGRAKDVAWQQIKNGKWYLCIHRRADRYGFHVCDTDYRRPVENDVPRRHVSVTTEELHWGQAAGYRQLATKFHPEHNGRTSDIQNINASIERLRSGVSS